GLRRRCLSGVLGPAPANDQKRGGEGDRGDEQTGSSDDERGREAGEGQAAEYGEDRASATGGAGTGADPDDGDPSAAGLPRSRALVLSSSWNRLQVRPVSLRLESKVKGWTRL